MAADIMLVELTVENYAVIERVRVRFHPGLNLLTGETGSGKSIVVDALGLLLGGRASAEMVRAGADRARVVGHLRDPLHARAARSFSKRPESNRKTASCWSSARFSPAANPARLVGNRPATAALLRDLAPLLGDIHGQHDQQQLFSPAVQRDMLDAFAGAEEPAREVAARVPAMARGSRRSLRSSTAPRRKSFGWPICGRFQRKEIEAVAPQPGEDAELENERRVLRNVVRLAGIRREPPTRRYTTIRTAPLAQFGTAAKRLEEAGAHRREHSRSARGAAAGRHRSRGSRARPAALPGRARSRPGAAGGNGSAAGRARKTEAQIRRNDRGDVRTFSAFLDRVKTDLAAVETSSERRQALEKDIARAVGGLRIGRHPALRDAERGGGPLGSACRTRAGGARHGEDPRRDSRRDTWRRMGRTAGAGPSTAPMRSAF